MRRFFLLVTPIFLFLITPAAVYAQEDITEEQESSSNHRVVPKGTVFNGDYFAKAQTVTISGTVNGDVYVWAGSVIVEGRINGDLIAAGGQVVMRGTVTQDMRATGGQVTVSGDIFRNLTAVAGNVELTDSARVAGSVTAVGGNISIFGPVGKEARLFGGNATIGSTIGGDIESGVGILSLTSKANLKGDLTYFSNTAANIQDGAIVAGSITQNAPQGSGESFSTFVQNLIRINIFFQLLALISAYIVGLILIKLFPNYTKKYVSTLEKRVWGSFGIGFLALVLTPIVILLLATLIVTIPISLIVLAIYLIALYLTRVYISYYIGKKVLAQFTKKEHKYWSLLVGLVVFSIIAIIPVIGVVFVILSVLFGLGAFYLVEMDIYRENRDSNIL